MRLQRKSKGKNRGTMKDGGGNVGRGEISLKLYGLCRNAEVEMYDCRAILPSPWDNVCIRIDFAFTTLRLDKNNKGI